MQKNTTEKTIDADICQEMKNTKNIYKVEGKFFIGGNQLTKTRK